jgi:hypothetical protein
VTGPKDIESVWWIGRDRGDLVEKERTKWLRIIYILECSGHIYALKYKDVVSPAEYCERASRLNYRHRGPNNCEFCPLFPNYCYREKHYKGNKPLFWKFMDLTFDEYKNFTWWYRDELLHLANCMLEKIIEADKTLDN